MCCEYVVSDQFRTVFLKVSHLTPQGGKIVKGGIGEECK